MSDQRWQRIEEICHDALEHLPDHRAAFVREACVGDDVLRAEVESLLASESRAEELGSGFRITDLELDLIGKQIGVYRIVSLLGAGGMGEVYRARDMKLGRDVAVKFLPHAFTNDPDRLARFEREARMLASLNHPHIGGIYGVEESDGAPALVLELVEGRTLADRVADGPISVSESLGIAKQIADALDAAHERGIVHRDLKPANIKITPDGVVKVLDFGLAKMPDRGARSDLTELPTVTADGTRGGAILGTVAYMSPEQAAGKPADKRSDIWAFGVVLFEMLTAQPVFDGETTSHVLAAVLTVDPDWSRLPAETPSAIRKLLRRCLAKDHKRRLESAADARLEIDDVLLAPSIEPIFAATPGRGWRKWTMATIAVMVAIVSAVLALTTRQPAAKPARFAIPVRGEISQLALSSDGRFLAFVTQHEMTGKNALSVQAIGQQHVTLLAGTEGATFPFWSPDSEYVGFFADGKLMKVKASGGPVQVIVPVTLTARGASWGSRNVIVYSQRAGGPLWRVNADGSDASVLTAGILTAEERSHRWPMFLPDGDRFLFWAGHFSKDGARNGIYLSSLSKRQKTFLVAARSNVGFAENGYLFYADEKRRLSMQPFDPDAGRITGDARVIADTIGFQPSLYFGAFTVSAGGTVVTNPSSVVSQSVLTWYDRSGKELGIVGAPAIMYNPSLSPDGLQLAADISDPAAANVDVWTFDLQSGASGKFTFGPLEEATPVWSPDGSRIAYGSSDTGMELKSTTGLEKERIVAQRPVSRLSLGGGLVSPTSWDRSGKYIVTRTDGTGQAPSYLALFNIGEQKLSRMLESRGNEANGQISPDGNWLAYASDESGVWNIYVTTFPGAAGKFQVSVGGGTEPRWRDDGKEMFYLDTEGVLTAVSIIPGATFSRGTPQPLFHVRARAPLSNTDVFSYDVVKDGSRFIVNRYVKPPFVPPLGILLNATAAAQTQDTERD